MQIESLSRRAFTTTISGGFFTACIRRALSSEHINELDPLIKVIGDVSEDFISEVNHELATLPEHIKDLLRSERYKVISLNDNDPPKSECYSIVICKRLTDRFPYLRNMHPRGWPKDMTWENSPATHSFLEVTIAEEFINPHSKQITRTTNVGGILKHEIGHAVDTILDISDSNEFKIAYEKDINALGNLDEDSKKIISYCLQNGSAGRKEAFAEVFAAVLGGTSVIRFSNIEEHVRNDIELFLKSFPNVKKYIEEEVLKTSK